MGLRQNLSTVIAVCASSLLVCCLAVPALAAAEGSFQRTLQVNGTASVDLSTGSGSVHVRTGNSGEVQITGHVKVTSWLGGDSEQRLHAIVSNPPIEQNGTDIRIGHTSDSELMHNVSISYDLVVPAETRLRSHTGSGSQDVRGLNDAVEIQSGSGELKLADIGAALRAETGSGDISIEQVKGSVRSKTGSGSIHASQIFGGFEGSTGSGHIVLEQAAAGAVRAETGSGGMELRGVQGSLEATAGSGTISAEGDPTGSWTVRTGSGSVHLKLAGNSGFDLNARTSSGSISVSQPLTINSGQINRKEVHGKVNGGGASVEVETGSGNIEIE
jgi:DUF4097 and DUF4098 domain-containing protein YvlB